MTKLSKNLRKALGSTALISILGFGVPAAAFCGFYVAKGGTDLFNESSKVVLVRDGDRTVITMANDYQGDPTEFAMVIPVPTIITKEQVHISSAAILEHLDAYTAPRLVEYFDDNPCDPQIVYEMSQVRKGTVTKCVKALSTRLCLLCKMVLALWALLSKKVFLLVNTTSLSCPPLKVMACKRGLVIMIIKSLTGRGKSLRAISAKT